MLTKEEMKVMKELATKLINKKEVVLDGLSPAEIFLLGMLKGREFTLEELGANDIDDIFSTEF